MWQVRPQGEGVTKIKWLDETQLKIAPILVTSYNNQYNFFKNLICDIQQVFVGYHEEKKPKK